MIMKGNFRDVIKAEGEPIEDKGWMPNSINEDFGRFLAATVKKDKTIEKWDFYIAVGNTSKQGTGERTKRFKENIKQFFEKTSAPYVDKDGNWAWAKLIKPEMIKYKLNTTVSQDITNMLQIDVNFEKEEPDSQTRELAEFSLLFKVGDGIYLMNYATHGTISKTSSMTLDRTIILKFPVVEPKGIVKQ